MRYLRPRWYICAVARSLLFDYINAR